MHTVSSYLPQASQFASQAFPNGSYIVLHSPQEIEVWGANLSEHYTIHIHDTDDGSIDVIYLGCLPLQQTRT